MLQHCYFITLTTITTDNTPTTITTDSTPTTRSAVATLEIAIVVTGASAFVVGVLAGVLLYHCISKHRSQLKPESSSHRQQQQADPEYKRPVTSGKEIELRKNMAYESVQRIELRGNVAYEQHWFVKPTPHSHTCNTHATLLWLCCQILVTLYMSSTNKLQYCMVTHIEFTWLYTGSTNNRGLSFAYILQNPLCYRCPEHQNSLSVVACSSLMSVPSDSIRTTQDINLTWLKITAQYSLIARLYHHMIKDCPENDSQ